MCLSIHANGCNELSRASASAPAPSAGLTSRKKPLRLFPPKAGSRRPQCKPHPTPSRGKRLRGTPTSLPTPTEEGGAQSFPSPRGWMPLARNTMKSITWTCLFGKPDPFTHATTCFQEIARSNRLFFTTRSTNPGCKDQGRKRMVKTSVQCRSFKVPSRSSEAEPLGYPKTPHTALRH